MKISVKIKEIEVRKFRLFWEALTSSFEGVQLATRPGPLFLPHKNNLQTVTNEVFANQVTLSSIGNY